MASLKARCSSNEELYCCYLDYAHVLTSLCTSLELLDKNDVCLSVCKMQIVDTCAVALFMKFKSFQSRDKEMM